MQEPPGQRRLQNVEAPASRRAQPDLGGLDIVDGNLAGATVRLGIEADLLALAKPVHARALERRCVNEYILAAVIGLDESITLLFVVEFDSAAFHRASFSRRSPCEPTSTPCVASGPVRRCLEESLIVRPAKPGQYGPSSGQSRC